MKTINDFTLMKSQSQPIAMLTAYDYISAQVAEAAGVDIILVGDSLGNVIHGLDTTIGVSLNDMIYHAQIVRRGATQTFMLVDMPYMTYHTDLNRTKKNAAKIMIKTRANAVKIEGGSPSRIDAIKAILDCEIPVCGHLGLTPQSINKFGEFKVQAKETKEQEILINQAIEIEQAGSFMLVLECIPEQLGKTISETLNIPTIGIGAGRYTDGQVIVWHDLLGLTSSPPKFVKRYNDLKQNAVQSVSLYVSETRERLFPAKENVYIPI